MKAKQYVYLAGRMSNDVKDKTWREKITPFLEELGFEVLNPYVLEPLQLKGLKPKRLPEGVKHWYELRKSTDKAQYERFKKYMQNIISYDIRLVTNKADIIVCRWSENCKTGAGTHAECTVAFMNKKPLYVIEEAKMPAWIEGCVEEKFKTAEELVEFFKREFGTEETKEEKDNYSHDD